MDVGTNRRVSPQSGAQTGACAEDILVDWLVQMPIEVDPADAARAALAAAPVQPGETQVQQRLRGLLVEVSRSLKSGSPTGARRAGGRRR